MKIRKRKKWIYVYNIVFFIFSFSQSSSSIPNNNNKKRSKNRGKIDSDYHNFDIFITNKRNKIKTFIQRIYIELFAVSIIENEISLIGIIFYNIFSTYILGFSSLVYLCSSIYLIYILLILIPIPSIMTRKQNVYMLAAETNYNYKYLS